MRNALPAPRDTSFDKERSNATPHDCANMRKQFGLSTKSNEYQKAAWEDPAFENFKTRMRLLRTEKVEEQALLRPCSYRPPMIPLL